MKTSVPKSGKINIPRIIIVDEDDTKAVSTSKIITAESNDPLLKHNGKKLIYDEFNCKKVKEFSNSSQRLVKQRGYSSSTRPVDGKIANKRILTRERSRSASISPSRPDSSLGFKGALTDNGGTSLSRERARSTSVSPSRPDSTASFKITFPNNDGGSLSPEQRSRSQCDEISILDSGFSSDFAKTILYLRGFASNEDLTIIDYGQTQIKGKKQN